MTVIVDTSGEVTKAKIHSSDLEILNEVVLAAARNWKFKPALQNNKPVTAPFSIQFHFWIDSERRQRINY